jgi:signal transduction histidine kinase/DNA-binding response OmpR family regulator
LVKFNTDEHTFKIYDEQDGLINCKSIYYGYQAFYLSKNGRMYYGTADNIISFHPDNIRDNPDVPKIQVTSFLLFNDPLTIGPSSILKKSITLTDTLQLTYNQNNISFEFAALDFTAPNKNQYAYILDGVDKDWVYSGNRHVATYTNLDHGEYHFRVKGSNNDGIWNDVGTYLIIKITPPWWKTVWAYMLYLIFVVGGIAATWHFQLRRINLRNELNQKSFETQKLQEVDQLKSRFFANISHEFRTPLTLILGPVEQLLSESFKGNIKKQYQIIIRNGRRLLRLINQLLDLSKLESGKMKLTVRQLNIVEVVKNYVQCFESLARRKNIILDFQAKNKSILLYTDRDKIEKVLNNLLSNAFKFTPTRGRIGIKLSVDKNPLYQSAEEAKKKSPVLKGNQDVWLKLSVADSGIGIEPNRLDKIFNRFYQIDDTQKRNYEGSGIGLSLTRELVELHHGIISVESILDKGTTFHVYLPLGKNYYSTDEIELKDDYSHPIEESIAEKLASDDITLFSNQKDIKPQENTKSKYPKLIIVEDNVDMRSYLKGNLIDEFTIIEAIDGLEGFQKVVHEIPDLIISDVMMPGMDGFELCKKIKTDIRTSHIPVILLTARAESAHKVEGLETGADDYMVKPFITEELLIRSKNLIEQRRKLKERFSKEIYFPLDDVADTQVDNHFTRKLMKIVNDHLSEFGFNIDNLSDELGMSRMNLHRKIQGLYGQSPGNFLRTIRLKRGAELLKNKNGNISEIAYEIGFESPNTFSKNFRRQFGISPSEFVRQPHYR